MAVMYNEILARGYEDINAKVRKGTLPLVARIPAIDKALSSHKLAQDEYYGTLRYRPIKTGEDRLLDNFANLILYEELTWSHPDKMSVIEYPIISERNERSRRERFVPHADLQYGDRQYAGRRKTFFTDKHDAPQVRNGRMVDPYDPTIEGLPDIIDLHDALNSAGLTERQRQAIDLVYFEDMTQEQAAEVMDVVKMTVSEHISVAMAKLSEYLP